mgnify:CR=1 FL=1
MLFDDKRRALRRALAGALLGMAGGGLAAWGIGSLFIGSPRALVLELLNCGFPRGLEGLGIALSFALYALFGAEVGVATLPFAGDGPALVGRTLAHFALTAATVGLWAGLNFGVRETAAFLVPLALSRGLGDVYKRQSGSGWAWLRGPPCSTGGRPCPMSPSPPCCV